MTIKSFIEGIDKRKVSGFVAAFLLLMISYLLLVYNTRKMNDQSKLVDHTNKVIVSLESLISDMKEVEFSYRGYLITREDRYIEDFAIYKNSTDSLFSLLSTLIKDNPEQMQSLDTIISSTRRKYADAEASMLLYKSNPSMKDSLLKFGYEGKYTGKISKKVRHMQYHESALLSMRAKDLQSMSKAIQVINLTILFIACLLAVYSFITYASESSERNKADNKAKAYRDELELRVQELSKANKELTELRSIEKYAATGRIARTIAHEVRNPLTNIHLAAEQLIEITPPGEERDMLLNMINRNGNRINQLVSDLLKATKFLELKLTECGVHDIINKAIEQVKDRIELNQAQLAIDYAPVQCRVKVDEEKMVIAFLNILVNATEAMEQGKGKLSIKTISEGSWCKIIITDNGSGMNEETLSKLFEPFFTNKQKGNGLGLANTQNIILNHKGNIQVSSEPGKGTSFTIMLRTIAGQQ